MNFLFDAQQDAGVMSGVITCDTMVSYSAGNCQTYCDTWCAGNNLAGAPGCNGTCYEICQTGCETGCLGGCAKFCMSMILIG